MVTDSTELSPQEVRDITDEEKIKLLREKVVKQGELNEEQIEIFLRVCRRYRWF